MGNSNDLIGMKWNQMLVLSILFHLAIFSIILFVPESIPARHIEGIVYEVNLVEMPGGGDLKLKRTRPLKDGKGDSIIKKHSKARRIQGLKKEEKPLVIAKRTVKLKKKRAAAKKPKISSSQLIDQAIDRIEKKIKSGDKTSVDRAISKLKSKVNTPYGSGPTRGQAPSGISIRIYQVEVEIRIKENWSYPVALQSSKDLEAIVVVNVKNNGTILKSRFKKRSLNAIFDQSVLKAIEKSDPLPPFPEGYRKKYDELEINFNLKDLEGY